MGEIIKYAHFSCGKTEFESASDRQAVTAA